MTRLLALMLLIVACTTLDPIGTSAPTPVGEGVLRMTRRRPTTPDRAVGTVAQTTGVAGRPEGAQPLAPSGRPGRLSMTALVRSRPSGEGIALGTIAAGTVVELGPPTPGPGCTVGWRAVTPRGYVCSQVEWTKRRVQDEILPHVPAGSRLPGVYGKVAAGAVVFRNAEAAARGEGQVVEGSLTVRRLSRVRVDGRKYWRTRKGLVARSDVRRQRGSRFSGVEIEDGLALPVAWSIRGKDRRSTPVYAEPGRRKVATRIAAHTPLSVVERSENGRFVHVRNDSVDGWMRRSDVRVAEAAEAPSAVRPGERWLDIDLSQQTLVAYEGATPVYATMISSGKVNHRTPLGVYRITEKHAERTMNSMPSSDDVYSVEKVPWTAYFAKGYALHAAFWHDGFGRARSHGCVNLSPLDARRLYDWMAPAAAPAWSVVYGSDTQPGTVIRIRSDRRPQPPALGYALRLLEADATAEQQPA